MTNKKINFISTMPRSGSTLLATLFNQSKDLSMTANSILPDMLYEMSKLKNFSIYENFPDQVSFDNVLHNIFNLYYKNWKASTILDKGPWGTPANLYLLQQIYKKLKFVILYRPVLECLASFVRTDDFKDIDEYCDYRMNINGRIGKELHSIKNLIETKQDVYISTYKKLTLNPQLEINKMRKFLGLDSFKINPLVLSQLKINKISYDDDTISAPLHKLKLGKIKNNPISIEKTLPKHIIKKYSNLDIL